METWREELYHHGILGMKWGVRRYQNADGSLTPAGKSRYGVAEYSTKEQAKFAKKMGKKIYKVDEEASKMLETRLKNRSIIENKYNKKIDKASSREQNPKNIAKLKQIEAEKRGELKDFDDGTKYVRQGYEKYADILNKYKDAKVKSFVNADYRNTDSYKKIMSDYTNQLTSNMIYGKSGTILIYSSSAGRDDYKKRGIINS